MRSEVVTNDSYTAIFKLYGLSHSSLTGWITHICDSLSFFCGCWFSSPFHTRVTEVEDTSTNNEYEDSGNTNDSS